MAMTKGEQQKLKIALMRVEEAEEREKVLFGNAPTNTWVSTAPLVDRPLLNNARITFCFPGGGKIQVMIKGDRLEIMGLDTISVYPQASNLVSISLSRWGQLNK